MPKFTTERFSFDVSEPGDSDTFDSQTVFVTVARATDEDDERVAEVPVSELVGMLAEVAPEALFGPLLSEMGLQLYRGPGAGWWGVCDEDGDDVAQANTAGEAVYDAVQSKIDEAHDASRKDREALGSSRRDLWVRLVECGRSVDTADHAIKVMRGHDALGDW